MPADLYGPVSDGDDAAAVVVHDRLPRQDRALGDE